MHETPKGANPSQDREQQQSIDRQQNQQGERKPGEGAGDATSGMQTEESGAGYGNNAGNQGSEAERGR